MHPIVSTIMKKFWEDPWDCFGENAKTLKNEHLIPYNPGLTFFQKINLAQTTLPIVLYYHAKN